MANTTIDAQLLSKMFLAGAENLSSNKEWINELNVFPVPDGDTGTNMTMTITSAVREVQGLGNSFDMTALSKAISSGSLRGARGNSGVILSQLLRGFCKVARDYETLGVQELADGFEKAVETAYKAVMKPKEGTILTVARETAEKAKELAKEEITLQDFCEAVIAEAESSLAKTPELLPVLKQAGVVDSGGQGLVQVLKGAYDGFMGKEVDAVIISGDAAAPAAEKKPLVNPDVRANAVITFGYCTEFIILLDSKKMLWNAKTEADFKLFLEAIGDSIVCVADDDVVKIHVHTNDPGLAIEKALQYGELSNIKIDNMRLEHKETLFAEQGEAAPEESAAEPAEKKEFGFVAICAGDGMEEIFKGLGVDVVITGGQTMNPSTDDILQAIEHINANTIFVLPNNKNIILAANQAASFESDKNVVVIPTKTIPQGITAAINFIPDMDAAVNEQNMLQEIAKVHSAEITYAVRNTQIDDMEIHEGDFMAITDKGLAANGIDRDEIAIKALESMVTEDTVLISIYFGADITEEEAEQFADKAREKFSSCDVELQRGGQPVYCYILSAED